MSVSSWASTADRLHDNVIIQCASDVTERISLLRVNDEVAIAASLLETTSQFVNGIHTSWENFACCFGIVAQRMYRHT